MAVIKSRFALANYFNALGFTVGAEIGVADGYFSEILCKAMPGLTLFGIDPWKRYSANPRGGSQNRQDTNREAARGRLEPYGVRLVQAMSMAAVTGFEDESLDFVFIDGHHNYEYVRDDIREWSKKVRKGGIVSGHDYYEFDNGGVIKAVDEYVKANNIALNIVPAFPSALKKDDRHPCFWWVK